jgi:hypothetical protein
MFDGDIRVAKVRFRPVGIYREVGFKNGQWRDVGWWRLALSNNFDVPAEPIAFATIQTDFKA